MGSASDVEEMTMTMMLSLKVSSKSRRAMIVASVVEPWLPSRRLVAGRATVATHVLKKAKTSSQRLVERRPTVLLRRFASGVMLMTLMMKAMIVASAVESSSPSRRLVVGRANVALHVWKKARASSQRLVERRPTVLLSRFASDVAVMMLIGVIKSMIGASVVESWLPSRKLVAGRAMVAMHAWKRASLSLKSLAERRPTVLLKPSAGGVEKMTMMMMLSLKVSSKSRRAMIVASVVELWSPSRRLV